MKNELFRVFDFSDNYEKLFGHLSSALYNPYRNRKLLHKTFHTEQGLH